MRENFEKKWTSYGHLRSEATALAGGLNDLCQRASVYHHLFAHSGGNHVFPLLAAHGALWARGYFRTGMSVGWLLSLAYAADPQERAQKLAQLAAFADAFRDINRRVCIETFTIYYLCEQPELLPFVEHHVPPTLIERMMACHRARRGGRQLSEGEKRELFGEFFLWEQHNIVGPSVARAVEAFQWPLLKAIAMRPAVRFSYLPVAAPLRFADFADTSERIERGFQAYDAGAHAGWAAVEHDIRRYGIMPAEFFADHVSYFRVLYEKLQHAPGAAVSMAR